MSRWRSVKKIHCEIEGCGVVDPALLDRHHIIERTEIGTSNDPENCAVLCANHHRMYHHGEGLEILGVLYGTSGRKLIYRIDGKVNVDGVDESDFPPKIKKAMKV